ncbi:MAG: tail fiber domain-containing protein [Rhizobacter sp.]|nr:tail fiber domain-containing protein [Ferruginibacter sp.]
MKQVSLLIQFLALSIISWSQGVAINNTGAQATASAMLDVNSTSKGFLIPRMTRAQRLAVPAPAVGLQVYQTDNPLVGEPKGFYFFNSEQQWQKIAGSGEIAEPAWLQKGNTGVPVQHFLGTTDGSDFRIATNSTTRMLFKADGNIGINTNAESGLLSIEPAIGTSNVPLIRLDDNRETTVPTMLLFNLHDNPLIAAGTLGKGRIVDIRRDGQGSSQPALAVSTKGLGAGIFGQNVSGFGVGVEGQASDGYGGVFRSPGGVGILVEGNNAAEINATGSAKDAVLVTMKSNSTNPAAVISGVHIITELTGTAGFLVGVTATPQSANPNAKLIGIYSAPRPLAGGVSSLCFQGDGNMTISGSYFSSSDRKIKKNIRPMEAALSKIMRLLPSTYEYKTDEYKMNLPTEKQNGLIAQEVQSIFPELVAEQTKPAEIDAATKAVISGEMKFLSINYTGLIPVLVSGMQEQQQAIDSLKKELAELKTIIRRLASK